MIRISCLSAEQRLFQAASSNDLKELQTVLDENPALSKNEKDLSDFYGFNAQTAAGKGHLPIVQELLNRGTISDSRYFLAFAAAKEKGHREIVQFLDERKTASQARFIEEMGEKETKEKISSFSPALLVAVGLGIAAFFIWHRKIIATFGRWG